MTAETDIVHINQLIDKWLGGNPPNIHMAEIRRVEKMIHRQHRQKLTQDDKTLILHDLTETASDLTRDPIRAALLDDDTNQFLPANDAVWKGIYALCIEVRITRLHAAILRGESSSEPTSH